MGIPGKALALGAVAAFAVEASALTVYTYSSFTADWGPGPAIEKSFERNAAATWSSSASTTASRYSPGCAWRASAPRPTSSSALDTNLTAEAQATGLLAPHGVDLSHLRLPVAWDDPTFVPFDYGWFAFVYNRENLPNPPSSLDGLVKAPETLKVIVQDPRTSTPGLGLLLWLRKVYGDGAGTHGRRSSPGSSPSPRDGARPTGCSSKARRRSC